MKKVKVFLMTVLAIASVSLVGCNSCDKNKDVFVKGNSLDFEGLVRLDYENMCGNVNEFDTNSNETTVFYEAQLWFDTTLDAEGVTPNIVKIMTVFQYKDTCTRIYHELIDGLRIDSINKVNDFWLEDCATVPYNNVNLDSAISIARNSGKMPPEKFAVMRRPLFPPFPTENYFIFGNIMNSVCVDAKDGRIITEY